MATIHHMVDAIMLALRPFGTKDTDCDQSTADEGYYPRGHTFKDAARDNGYSDVEPGPWQSQPPPYEGPLGFEHALEHLKRGGRAMRLGWNGRGQWVGQSAPAISPGMTLSFLYIRTVTGDLVPWLASQTDLLANDWRLL